MAVYVGQFHAQCRDIILYGLFFHYTFQIQSRMGLGLLFTTDAIYDTRCYFNVRSKADISQLNLTLCYR